MPDEKSDPVSRYVRLDPWETVEALTKAEAAVLLSLLGADWRETERHRIRTSGIPRSTYQEAKRRLYQEGYLLNRFIPDPHAFGFDGFRFLVARPFVGEIPTLARQFESDPRTVTLWVGATSLFVVQLFGPAPTSEPEGPQGLAGTPTGTVLAVNAGVAREQIPIFFDPEGMWARVVGDAGPLRYPRGVPCPGLPDGAPHSPPGPRAGWALRELLARPFATGIEGREPAHLGAPFLPRSERHLLAQGWAAWRVLPALSKTLAHGGREIRQLIVITGRLQPGLRLPQVTGALARRTGSSPILAATDGTQVILVALGGVGARDGRTQSTSVLGTLTATLTDLQIVREDLWALSTPLDLRFDRIPSTTPGRAPT